MSFDKILSKAGESAVKRSLETPEKRAKRVNKAKAEAEMYLHVGSTMKAQASGFKVQTFIDQSKYLIEQGFQPGSPEYEACALAIMGENWKSGGNTGGPSVDQQILLDIVDTLGQLDSRLSALEPCKKHGKVNCTKKKCSK